MARGRNRHMRKRHTPERAQVEAQVSLWFSLSVDSAERHDDTERDDADADADADGDRPRRPGAKRGRSDLEMNPERPFLSILGV